MTKSSKPENAADLARNIWLAGLGAYGKAWDQAQDRLEKAEKDTAKLFDDLVSKGQKIEKETQKKVQEVADLSGNFSIEDRLQKVRDSFGFSSAAADAGEMEALKEEVAALTKQVGTLSREIRKLKKLAEK